MGFNVQGLTFKVRRRLGCYLKQWRYHRGGLLDCLASQINARLMQQCSYDFALNQARKTQVDIASRVRDSHRTSRAP
jgi:hypothetical protein